jgi:hypothetical protein
MGADKPEVNGAVLGVDGTRSSIGRDEIDEAPTAPKFARISLRAENTASAPGGSPKAPAKGNLHI